MIEPRLDHLPQELIDQITSDFVVRCDEKAGSTDFLQDRGYYDCEDLAFYRDKLADLVSLSRTCKRLSVACAPTLLRRVTIDWSDRSILYFLQSLLRKPYLGTYVQVFKASGGERDGKEEEAIDEVVEEVLKPDPVARTLLQEDPSALWDIITACTLKLLPGLAALTTSSAVMQMVTRWPEEQRLHGSSISALQIVHAWPTWHTRKDIFDNYCEDMFEWKQAFRPGNMPAALQYLGLEHRNCQAPRLQDDYCVRRPLLDIGSLHIAASLHRLDLQSWLPTDTDYNRNCVARQLGELDECRNLTHLTFIDENASLRATLRVISKSPTLTTNLLRLEFRLAGGAAEDSVDVADLKYLSKFKNVTALTLPWLEIAGTTPLRSKVWPPSLQSMTLSVFAHDCLEAPSLATIIMPFHFPATLRDITFKWYITEVDKYHGSIIPELVDIFRARNRQFASSRIALLHEHPDPCDLDEPSLISTSTNIERE